MPEILLLLTFVGFVAYRIAAVAEQRRVKSPAEIENEIQRLAQRQAWLSERIRQATEESWSADDVRRLRTQLADVESAQAELAPRASTPNEPR